MKEYLKNEYVIKSRDYNLFNQYADLSGKKVKLSNHFGIEDLNPQSTVKFERFLKANTITEGLVQAYGVRNEVVTAFIEYHMTTETENYIELNLNYVFIVEGLVMLYGKNEVAIAEQLNAFQTDRTFLARICCLYQRNEIVTLMNNYLGDKHKTQIIRSANRNEFTELVFAAKYETEKVESVFSRMNFNDNLNIQAVLTQIAA